MTAELSDAFAQRQQFLRVQAVKGALGALLCLGYCVLFGLPGRAEGFTFAAILAPVALALAARAGWPLMVLERASLAFFAILVALLGNLTGGLASPLLLWLAVVPFEGALAGGKGSVAFAGGAAIFAFLAVAISQGMGLLPLSRLPEPASLWYGLSLAFAIVQASAMAISAQAMHRRAVAADLKARQAHEAELIRARDLALDANRAKSRFLANMSHELRTPLNAVLGFSEIMVQELFGPVGSPRYVEYARVINESGAHLLELINSILDMSKIEAGRLKISCEIFDLSEMVQQALRFVKLPAERHALNLEWAVDPSAQQIFADKRALLQVLINVLTNSVKFTPARGSIRVIACKRADGIEITVSDTGIGIAEADLKRIGQPFEQAENAFTRSTEGTGLGLALVHALMQLHGGSAHIESVVGEGTIVRLLLPHAAAAASRKRVLEAVA